LERDVAAKTTWVLEPMYKIVAEFQASLKKYPPIKIGTPDPYIPPKLEPAAKSHDANGKQL
jgi:hypothetical protein